MNENDKLILEKNGWVIECESPFEIRNKETGDFVTGFAAKTVIESLKPKRRTTCYCGNPIDQSNPDCIEYLLCKDHAMDI